MSNYILDGKKTVKCDDIIKWAMSFEVGDRSVAHDKKDGIRVSTVFLGIDHQFGEGEPLLFETMIFGGDHDECQYRYSTYEEAEAGHNKACLLAFD